MNASTSLLLLTLGSAGLVSLTSGLLLTRWVKNFALRKGLVDGLSERKIHKTPIPRLGGVAILGGFLIGMLFLVGAMKLFPSLAANIHLPSKEIVIGALIMSAFGFVDDIFGLRPWEKLVAQSLMATLVILGGFRFNFSFLTADLLGFNPDYVMVPLTFVWILAVVNAVNLIDGMDGLATGVAFSVIGSLSAAAAVLGHGMDAALIAPFLGALLGFLFYNFHPAKIFMGDSGSLFIGFILATYALPVTETTTSSYVVFLIPVLALGLPILDTTMAFTRRLLQGKSPFAADRDHIHHRLADRFRLSHRDTVLALYGISVVFGISAFALAFGRPFIAVGSLSMAGLVTLYILFRLGYVRVPKMVLEAMAENVAARLRRLSKSGEEAPVLPFSGTKNSPVHTKH